MWYKSYILGYTSCKKLVFFKHFIITSYIIKTSKLKVKWRIYIIIPIILCNNRFLLIFSYLIYTIVKNLKSYHINRFRFLSSDGHITTLRWDEMVYTNPTSIFLLRGWLVHPTLVRLLPHEAICYELIGQEVSWQWTRIFAY